MGTTPPLEIELGAQADLGFESMGTRVRLMVGRPARAGLPPAEEAAELGVEWVAGFDHTLSRFRSESELTLLNRDPRRLVPASGLMRDFVSAAVEAAQETGGLVDPTLSEELATAGYGATRTRTAVPLLEEALRAAPPRRPAKRDPRSRWSRVSVDARCRAIRRPPGVSLDSGGVGKGLAADLLASGLAGYERYLIDCGGDIRVGGPLARLEPYMVEVAHPLGRGPRRRVRLASGAVATSGIDGRIWRQGDGFGHHLLDPSTGDPAWTGVISATALAPTTVAAETRSKAALLAGPEGARQILAGHGGLFVHDDGRCEVIAAPGRMGGDPDGSAT